MPRIKAQRLLEEVDRGKIDLDPETLYDTVLTATDNKELADSYRVARIRAAWKPR